MIFFTGVQVLKDAGKVEYAFISINRFIGANKRKSDFPARVWIMDSGAFSQIFKKGEHALTPAEYAAQIKRWSRCGILARAVAQDYMCEDFILKKLGRTVKEHQDMTVNNYIKLVSELQKIGCKTEVMPVLQGYESEEYVEHLRSYGDLVEPHAWVGVGSVCKRNSNPDSVGVVLDAIKKERPDLRLHGFGVKKTCLQDAYVSDRLFSSDSMAWSFDARYTGKKAHDINHAIAYRNSINNLMVQENLL